MKRVVLFLITIYQKFAKLFPKACIYEPSCSEYARQTFVKHSFLKAFFFSVARILRCNPFCRGGCDPVR